METPEYIFEEAAAVAHKNITSNLQQKFSLNDILEILLIEDEFFDSLDFDETNDIDHPVEIDDHAMISFIINGCKEKNIILTPEELEEILDGEYVYLEQKGLVEGEE